MGFLNVDMFRRKVVLAPTTLKSYDEPILRVSIWVGNTWSIKSADGSNILNSDNKEVTF